MAYRNSSNAENESDSDSGSEDAGPLGRDFSPVFAARRRGFERGHRTEAVGEDGTGPKRRHPDVPLWAAARFAPKVAIRGDLGPPAISTTVE